MTLPSKTYNFGEWLPDLPDLASKGMSVVENAFPTTNGYTEVPGLEYRGGSVDGRVVGSHWVTSGGAGAGDTMGDITIFAGTATNLYRLDASSNWEIVSKSGGYTGVFRWVMASFGRRLIAVPDVGSSLDAVDPGPQFYDVGTSALFADLPGAPNALTIGLIRDFAMMGNTGRGQNFIEWSAFNNTELWTPSRATQAGFISLSTNGGAVQTIVSGSEGHIFLEDSVYKLDYVGPPVIFRADEVGPGRGTRAPESVIRVGQSVYYYDNAGFYRYDIQGSVFEAIGQGKVDDWFRDNIDGPCIIRMKASVDPSRKTIMWSCCEDQSSDRNTIILVYHYELRRWGVIRLEHDTIALLPTKAFSLDELDGPPDGDGPLPGGIDFADFNVDSTQFSGGSLSLGLFGSNHRLASLSGAPLTARFTTPEFGSAMNNRVYTNLQRPMYYGRQGITDGSLTISYRDHLNARPATTPPALLTARGTTEAKTTSRYQRYNLEISGGFDNVFGLEVFSRVA